MRKRGLAFEYTRHPKKTGWGEEEGICYQKASTSAGKEEEKRSLSLGTKREKGVLRKKGSKATARGSDRLAVDASTLRRSEGKHLNGRDWLKKEVPFIDRGGTNAVSRSQEEDRVTDGWNRYQESRRKGSKRNWRLPRKRSPSQTCRTNREKREGDRKVRSVPGTPLTKNLGGIATSRTVMT